MEPTFGENPSPLSPNEERLNPNPKLGNVNFEIDAGLRIKKLLGMIHC
jgi:hypothetical protein